MANVTKLWCCCATILTVGETNVLQSRYKASGFCCCKAKCSWPVGVLTYCTIKCERDEVLMAIATKTALCWDVKLSRLVGTTALQKSTATIFKIRVNLSGKWYGNRRRKNRMALATLKMKGACSSVTFVPTYQTIRYHVSENINRYHNLSQKDYNLNTRGTEN